MPQKTEQKYDLKTLKEDLDRWKRTDKVLVNGRYIYIERPPKKEEEE